MRKFLLTAIAFCAFTACDKYDDSKLWKEVNNQGNKIDFLESELEALKLKVEGLNQTYKAITSMLNGGVITAVSPITDGDKTGYVITVQTIVDANTTPVTTATTEYKIWNGTNGKDGEDGEDGATGATGNPGSTPQITVVKEEATGLYYWVIDGKPLTDASGNYIYASAQNGTDGTPGTPGTPGAAGKDGNTPQLKIDKKSASDPTLVWWVSYDNGANWIELGVFDGTVEGSNISVSVVDGKVVISQSGQDPISFDIVEANKIKINLTSIDFAKGLHLALNVGNSVPYTLEGASGNAVVKAEMLQGSKSKFNITHEPEKNKFWVNATGEPGSDIVLVHVYDGNMCIHTSFNVYSDIATATIAEREVTLPLLYGDADDYEYTGRITLDMPAAEDMELTVTAGDATLPAENFTVSNVSIAKGASSAAYKVVVKRSLTEGSSYTLPLTFASASNMGRFSDGTNTVSINVTDTPSKIALTGDMLKSPYTYENTLAVLCDGLVNNHWGTNYSSGCPDGDSVYGVYVDITLTEPLCMAYFRYCTRHNNDNAVPTEIAVGVSNDGDNWTKLFSTDQDLPTGTASWWDGDTAHALEDGSSFSKIRFGITKSKLGDLIENAKASTALCELEVYGLY